MDPALDLNLFTCFPLRFWSFLLSGRDPISEIPIERFDVDELYEEDRGAPGKVYVREGGFIPGVEAISGCQLLGKRGIGCVRCRDRGLGLYDVICGWWLMFNGHSNYIMWLITRLKTVFVIVMRHSLKDHPKTIWNNQKPDTADFHLVSQRWPVEIQEFDAAFFGIAEPEARSMDTHQRLQTETAYVTWLVGSGVGWFRRKPWSLGMGESCRVFWGSFGTWKLVMWTWMCHVLFGNSSSLFMFTIRLWFTFG